MNFNHFVYGEEKYVPVQSLIRNLNLIKEKIKKPDFSKEKKVVISSTNHKEKCFFEKKDLNEFFIKNIKNSIKEVEELC